MIADHHPAGRELAGRGELQIDGGEAAHAALVQPLGTLGARSIAPQFAMLPETVERRGEKSRQSHDSSGELCQWFVHRKKRRRAPVGSVSDGSVSDG